MMRTAFLTMALAVAATATTTAHAAHCGTPALLQTVARGQQSAEAVKEARAEGIKRKTCAAAQTHLRNNEATLAMFRRLPKHCIHDPAVPMTERAAREQAEVRSIIRENCPPPRKPSPAAAKAPAPSPQPAAAAPAAAPVAPAAAPAPAAKP